MYLAVLQLASQHPLLPLLSLHLLLQSCAGSMRSRLLFLQSSCLLCSTRA